MNPVYLRLLAYVISGFAVMIPAEWAGFVAYNADAQTITLSVQGLAAAIVGGMGISSGVFALWGKK
jgi:hypothetical protein